MASQAPPSISVVLPVYNGADVLEGAVRSVLGQTFGDFELLIVNDGSTDDTAARIAMLADPRIRTIHLPKNEGRSTARNRGISLARGQAIALIDADDFWYPDRLRLQSDFMGRHPEIALCGSWGRLCEPGGRLLEWRQPLEPSAIRKAILYRNPFIHCSVLVRMEALKEAGGYDQGLDFGEDYDLFLRIVRRHDTANLPEFLVRYNAHRSAGYQWRDARARMRMRWRALARYGYPKRHFPALLLPLLTMLLPLRLSLWLKRVGRGAMW